LRIQFHIEDAMSFYDATARVDSSIAINVASDEGEDAAFAGARRRITD